MKASLRGQFHQSPYVRRDQCWRRLVSGLVAEASPSSSFPPPSSLLHVCISPFVYSFTQHSLTEPLSGARTGC